jgi:hypothetical protein
MKMGDQKSRDMLEKIYNQTTPTQQTTNVQNGICKSTSPGGCMRKSFDDLGNNLGTKVNEAKDKMMDFMKKSPILTLYNYFLQIMIFSNTLHNAMMLSNSIGSTLGMMLDNVLAIINLTPKDESGGDLSVSTIFGKSLRGVLGDILAKGRTPVPGETEEKREERALKLWDARWNSFNRIYQAATNSFYAIQNLFQSLSGLATNMANNMGKIGNALLTHVFDDDTYERMGEEMKQTGRLSMLMKYNQGATDVLNVVSALEQITSEVRNIQEESKEVAEAGKELADAIAEAKTKAVEKNNGTEEGSKLDFPEADMTVLDIFLGGL